MSSIGNFDLKKARVLQLNLSKKVIKENVLPKFIKHVAGVDIAYSKKISIGAVADLDYNSLEIIEEKTSFKPIPISYIPTFLAFREASVAISTILKLDTKPDIFFIDGHGIAYPRRLGFASHLGLILDKPTIGIAKKILCGETKCNETPWKLLVLENEIVGAEVQTIKNVKPIYVIICHKISLKTTIEIVLACSRESRIPEPI